MRCSFRPPARASTCSVTTGIAEKCFAVPWKGSSMLRSISPGRAPLAEYDNGVVWAALLLLTFGMVMVYSSSIAMAEASKFTGGKSSYFLERHALFLAASTFAGMLAFQVPVRLWQQAAPWLFVLGVALLALLAFGRGEWFGVGLGASVEKLLYLPEAHTDFLLAVIGEELGFVGVIAVIALFSWLVLRAFAIGRQAVALERPYPALVAQGIGVWFGVQSFINMGVNMGVLPTKGLT